MADDDVTVGDVLAAGQVIPMPADGMRRVSPINAGNAAEMAHRKAEKEAETRAERQVQRQKRAEAVLGDAAGSASLAIENRSLDLKSVEELADMQVKRMLKVVLLGGEAFLPTSPKEAMELANAPSLIAYREVQRRQKAGVEEPTENELSAMEVNQALRLIRKRAAKGSQAG